MHENSNIKQHTTFDPVATQNKATEHTGLWTRPVTTGSRWRRAECTEYFGAISAFVRVRSALWAGGNSASSGRNQKLFHMLGQHVSQQCQ